MSCIILTSLLANTGNLSFVSDLLDLSYEKRIDFMNVLVSKKPPAFSEEDETRNEDIEIHRLKDCLNSWCDPVSRKVFVNIMEGNVVRAASD